VTNNLRLLSFVSRSTELALVVALVAGADYAQSLSGKVIGSNGQPVGAAVVIASRTSSVPWTNSRTSTAANGSFSFSSLIPGTYQFCVQVLAGGYLDPCDWSPTPPTTTIAAGSAVTGYELNITAGSLLQIEVTDPNNIASAAASPSAPALLALGVHFPRGIFKHAIFRSKDATGINHFDVTIPFDTPVSLEILNSSLQVTQANATVAASINVVHSSTATTAFPILVFQIAGITP
jgi:hypothetical protein